MNTLILSGKVLDNVRMVGKPNARPHAVFQLWVTNETRSGVRNEAYWINCWGGTAHWAMENVKRDAHIVVMGGLTQLRMEVGGKTTYPIEVAATRIAVDRDVSHIEVQTVGVEGCYEAD